MTPERWQRVKGLFDAALEREGAARARFLSEATPDDPSLASEVLGLLASDQEAGAFLSAPPLPPSLGESLAAPGPSLVGRHIGPYRVLAEIGQGGMGTVYRAVRDDDQYQKQVAIKLVRGGMDAEFVLQRFRAERQILANLEHPNIARLVDGGTTDEGWPYFSMEYVEGQPIDRYCAGLGVRERLELFRTVCAAVQYAHQRLVIHRDLKPSNIFVSAEGVPKLLDFGIAKLLGADALGPGEATLSTVWPLMTPEYASPEQVKGEAVTTASDVYSLGMLLYELLAGKRAYEIKTRAPEELARVVCQQQPEKPSALAERPLSRQLTGDLDTIVLKAIRKELARRYQTVVELSDDLGRHLAGRPVLARGDTVGYRAGKFVRRHKAAVVVAGLLALSLLGGIAATVREARIAEANRARAERRFNDVRTLANSFLFEVHDAIATLPGSTPARELVVRRALEYLDSLAQEAGGDASLQRELAAAYHKVGDVQGEPGSANLGQAAGALESYRKALSLREALAAAGAKDAELQNDLARSHGRVGTVLGMTGDAEGAMFHWQQALAIRQALAARDPANPKVKRALAIGYHELGDALVDRGDLPGAMGFYRQELALFQELAAADPTNPNASRNLALAHKKVGATLVRMGQSAPALEHYQEALRLDESRLSPSPEDAQTRMDVSFDHSDIGLILANTGDTTGAIERYRKVVAIREELSRSDPRNAHARTALASAYVRLALPLAAAGRMREALAACRRGVAIRQALAAADPATPPARREVASAELVLGDLLKQSGDPHGALESYRLAVTLDEALAMSDPADAGVRRDLAILYGRLGELHEALALQPRLPRDSQLKHWNQARSWYEKGRTALRDLPSGGAPALRDEEPDPDGPARGVARCDAALARLGRTADQRH